MNRFACAAVTLLFLTEVINAADSVRVEVMNGVPRLMVDGQPVRPRVFWGAPGSRPLKLSEKWEQVSFEFTALQDEPKRATMHLRFGQGPGEIVLDDIRVVSMDGMTEVIPNCDFERGQKDFEHDWTYWPTGAANTVGEIHVVAGIGHDGSHGLRIQLKAPADGHWPDFHVYHVPNLGLKKGGRYRVSFWARAQPARNLTVAFYRPGTIYLMLGGPPNVLESQVRLAASAGANFVSFPVQLPWPEGGAAENWDVVDQECEMILEANPQALLMPRISVRAPTWWCQAHPDAVMKWDDKGPHPTDACVESSEYLHDAAARLKALIAHLESRYGKHMAGYHPCGQNTSEWFYHDTWGPGLSGYSPATEHAWRAWLSARYASDQALQTAWKDASMTRDNAWVPVPAARRGATSGLLRDPDSEQRLIDFAEFQQTMMANCVCHFARAAREASQGKRLVLFFYGYVHEFGAVQKGPATSGHYALRQVLNCPDIDVLCSPISYFDRGLGESGPAMTAAESVALAGKMYLMEDDTYTYLGTGKPPGWNAGAKTVEDTNKLLLRNTSQCAVRNFATWWMDLAASGWFEDPRMWEIMKRLETVDQDFLKSPQPYRPEVAVVVDEASMLNVAFGGSAVTRPCVYEIRGPLGRMGTPYGQYLMDDVVAGRVHAKLYVFANAWRLSEQQRRDLLKATAGATKVWCYAPGYLEPTKTSVPAMKELTGFDLQPVTVEKAQATVTDGGRAFGLTRGWGPGQKIQPLFAAMDAQPKEVLATYSNGKPAVAWRDHAQGAQLFVGTPGVTSELLRATAKRAGVHLYVDRDCQVYANGRYVVLHAAEDGPVVVDTSRKGTLTDFWTGKTLGQGPRVTLTMSKGDTRVLMLDASELKAKP